MSDNFNYTAGVTGLWLHDADIDTKDPNHDFESRKDDLFTLMEYSPEDSPAKRIYEYVELREMFPENLELEYIISCHRIRESNAEFEYTNYLFFKFAGIPLPIAWHESDNTGTKTYFHLLSNRKNASSSKIDYLRCLSLAMAGPADTLKPKAEKLLEVLKSTVDIAGSKAEDDLITAVNGTLKPYEPIQVRWNCRPPN